jgi:hypothetical protein
MLQFLQASPQARRDVSALLSVPRTRKKKHLNAGLIIATVSGDSTKASPYGSFYHDTYFRSIYGDWRLLRRSVFDYGADINLIIPKTLVGLGVKSRSIKGTVWDKYCFKPVTGPPVRLRTVANVEISVGGIEVTVQFFVIPEEAAQDTGFAALFGLPFAHRVSGNFNVRSMTMDIQCPVSGRKVTLKGPPYQPLPPIPLTDLKSEDSDSDSERDSDSSSDGYDTSAYSNDDDSDSEPTTATDALRVQRCQLSIFDPHHENQTLDPWCDAECISAAEYARRFPKTDLGSIANRLAENTWRWSDDNGNDSDCELGFLVQAAPLGVLSGDENSDEHHTVAELRAQASSGTFPTTRRIERREEKDFIFPSDHELATWARDIGVTIGDVIWSDPDWRRKVLQLCWMWKDVGAQSLADMDVTDLVSVVPWFKGQPTPYACKINKRLTPEAEKFFMETVREGLSADKYIHIYSEWNAPTVVAYKPAVANMDKN